jgi:TrpR-related protein YerC/YecD
LLALDTVGEMRSFLRDLCTPAELEALIDRWRVVPYLLRGMAYREIHDRTAVSVTTIGRVARFLSQGNGGYQAAIAHHAVPDQLKQVQLKQVQLKGVPRKRGQAAGAPRTASPAKRVGAAR